MSFILLLIGYSNYAQVVIPFAPRTSSSTPTRTIYSIKGDFTMIGNTNMMAASYSSNATNSNANMIYVDVDGNNATVNSSSAVLSFSTENDAIPECSEIQFAGLYWTGRAGGDSVFTVTNVPVNNNAVAVNQTAVLQNGNDVQTTSLTSTFDLIIDRFNDNGNRSVRYTFEDALYDNLIIEFSNTAPYVQYRHENMAAGMWLTPNNLQIDTIPGGTPMRVATFDPIQFYSNATGTVMSVDSIARVHTNSSGGGGGTSVHVTSSRARILARGFTYTGTVNVTKSLNKRRVLFKGPSASVYDTVYAQNNSILFPSGSYGDLYCGFAEVTDYVRTNGAGEYTLADLAIVEGNGSSTGYYGGWTLIVVYENSRMKWRDITIFDGYTHMEASVPASVLEVSGFAARQNGPVDIKMGMLAGEGDKSIPGEYFNIRNQSNVWDTMSHIYNSKQNFFQSSILIDHNYRTPYLMNNTGLDILMFNLDNSSKNLIDNGDTATEFQFGSTQDLFGIFMIAFAIDAYVPDVAPINNIIAINGGSVADTVLPGDTLTYQLIIMNQGTEAILDATLNTPIPYTSEFLDVNTTYFTTITGPNAGYNNTTSSIVWGMIDSIPVPDNTGDTFALIEYRIIATTDCRILSNPHCSPAIPIDGVMSGYGAISLTPFSDFHYILGHQTSGSCIGDPIPGPISTTINGIDFVNTNCVDEDTLFIYLIPDTSTLSTIAFDSISPNYPDGMKFYNEFPVTGSTIEYTSTNNFPMPANIADTGVYYVAADTSVNCFFMLYIAMYQALPVDFLSFDVNLVGDKARINWEVAKEVNVEKYIVEKSKNGKSFYPVNTVSATIDNTTEGNKQYESYDDNLNVGLNFYRIKQIDYDGSYAYTSIKNVNYALSDRDIVLFPNPTKELLNISGLKMNEKINIINAYGQVVYTSEITANSHSIHTSGLSAGVYNVMIQSQTGKIYTLRFTKE